MSYIWHTIFFDPVYNLLVFFIDIFPRGDVGLAIIAAVVVVKIILLPLSIKAVKTQKLMREINPELKAIKEKYKNDQKSQAEAMLALYRDKKMNPLSSIVVMFIQIPFIIALYFAVIRGGGIPLPEINTAILYSFTAIPTEVSMLFLNSLDITLRSLPLALLAGVVQFFSTRMTMPTLPPKDPLAAPNFKDDFSRNMQVQMRYVMPGVIFAVCYTLSAAFALYIIVSNLVTMAQEVFVRKHR